MVSREADEQPQGDQGTPMSTVDWVAGGDTTQPPPLGEQQFLLLVESVRDYAIFILDPDGKVTSWNEGAKRIKGYAASEIIGEHFSLFYTGEATSAGEPGHSLATAARTGRCEENGWRVRKDGSQFWANVTITPLYDSAGEVSGYGCVTRDLTERKLVEEEGRLVSKLTRAIAEAETVDDAMQLTLSEICKMADWKVGEAWVRSGSKLECSPAWYAAAPDLDRFRAPVGMAIEPGFGLPGVAWRDKKPVWMRDIAADSRFLRAAIAKEIGVGAGMAVPVLSEDEVVAVLVFFVFEPRDVDEELIEHVTVVAAQLGSLISRKQTEDALREREEQLRSLAQTAVDAIVSADSRGNIIFFNRSAERIFGYSAADMVGQPLTLLMPERFHTPHERGLVRYLETGVASAIGKTIELAGLKSNGEEFPLELSLSTWHAGGETFFTGFLRDISERKRAQEILQKSDLLKTAVLRAVSHDLRSPLTAIVAAGESIVSPNLEARSRSELASVIVQEASRLARLVDKLLDLSRLQGGVASPRQVWCSIEELLDVAIEQMPESGEEIVISVEPELPSVRADAAQLERVFVNLFENARRFASGRPIHVEAYDKHGEQLVVCVSDSGPGIPEAEQERVFEPFYRIENGDVEYRGSGLGLAIVRGFVEANGGNVWVESSPGDGSTFVIELPLPQQ
jgi:PAS domain S-box-containing protein